MHRQHWSHSQVYKLKQLLNAKIALDKDLEMSVHK